MAKKDTSKKETPLMKQYNGIKAKYPSALLLFRVGDFYETFGKDAIIAADILGIILTNRRNGEGSIELAGFPHHSLDTYLPKLVRAGQRVAICDQLEDPKMTKSIVKRGVTELVTPGVSYSDKVLEHKSNNYLAAIHQHKNNIGISFLDVSTGEFLVAEGDALFIDKLIQGYKPKEILFQRNKEKDFINTFGNDHYTYKLDEWIFNIDFAKDTLLNHFKINSFKGFGIDDYENGIIAAGAIMQYLSDTRNDKLSHIQNISRISRDEYVWLDKFTIRNLELIGSQHQDATTLFDILDHTTTPMGARMLKKWVVFPLKNIQAILKRQEVVSYFLDNEEIKEEISTLLKNIGDIERITARVAVQKINPREIKQLSNALASIHNIKKSFLQSSNQEIKFIGENLDECSLIKNKIDKEIIEEPATLILKGGVIADGVNDDLDELRSISKNGKDYLLELQQKESVNTEISSLKIGFNNVFGYYFEVRNTHKDKVPEGWVRKQTLTGAERYITPELKEYEEKILGAEEKILALEINIYNNLVFKLAEYIKPLQTNAKFLANVDCLISFSSIALNYNYCKPHLNDGKTIDIKEGRHPVIETQLGFENKYIPNDVYLDDEKQQIIMITGPNMSGKSAILRQTALIVLMAQIGCYVPATAAEIGIVDKIFTRVGASDNISSGESTFMVEMNETASIVNNLSDRSLILLDEIGRGTSTYDGISIAWAIAEYLHEHPSKGKTLFATHYHELNDMTKSFPRIKNFNVSVKELDKKVIFMRKLVEGGSEHSFGIHVAKMAGMPTQIITKANIILKTLEKSHQKDDHKKAITTEIEDNDLQLSFFKLDDPILEQIREEIKLLDIDTITPVEALMKLNEIKSLCKK